MDFESEYKKIEKMVRWRVERGVEEFEVEDVIQDVMMRVWEKWSLFDGEHLSGWVDTVTGNFLKNYYRKKSIDTVSLNAGWEDDEEPDTPRTTGLCDENTPDMELEAEQVNQALKDREEECLEYYASGLDHGEISALMGVTEGSVRMTISRSKQKLES